MSKRRSLQGRIHFFKDLRDILDAIKNVALIEISKLTRTQRYRHHLLGELLSIATLTSAYHPRASRAVARQLYVVLGSERGFCSDFDSRIAAFWEQIRAADPDAAFILVGSALSEKPHAGTPLAVVSGPLTAEEIDAVLIELLRHIADWQQESSLPTSLSIVAADGERVSSEAILPFEPPNAPGPLRRPTLNIAPDAFIRQFIDQYVDARLHDAFASSLLAENHARLQHMTAAIGRIDDGLGALQRKSRRLRQQEITQEVETLLLAADYPSGAARSTR